jgi:hypothetical protein
LSQTQENRKTLKNQGLTDIPAILDRVWSQNYGARFQPVLAVPLNQV